MDFIKDIFTQYFIFYLHFVFEFLPFTLHNIFILFIGLHVKHVTYRVYFFVNFFFKEYFCMQQSVSMVGINGAYLLFRFSLFKHNIFSI